MEQKRKFVFLTAAGRIPGEEAEKAMKGFYYVCPACRKSYSKKSERSEAKKETLICPDCGREMQVIRYYIWK